MLNIFFYLLLIPCSLYSNTSSTFIAQPSQQEVIERMTELFKYSAEDDSEIDHYATSKKAIVSQTALDELEIISTRTAGGKSIKEVVDRTSTISGKIHLLEMLQNPTNSTKAIQRRQRCIEFMLNNRSVQDECSEIFKKIASHEKTFYSFWTPNESLVNIAKSMSLLEGASFVGLTVLLSTLSALDRSGQTIANMGTIMGNYYKSVAKVRPDSSLHNINRILLDLVITSIGISGGISAIGAIAIMHHHGVHPLFLLAAIFGTFAAASFVWHFYRKIQQYGELASLLSDIKAILESSEDAVNVIGAEKILYKNLTFAEGAEEAIENEYLTYQENGYDVDIEALLNSPGTTGTGLINYLIRNKGKANAAIGALLLAKNQILPILRAIGELDVCVSCARLIQEHKDSTNQFCFPKLIENKTPVISLDKVWHPTLNPTVAVGSTLSLGANKDEAQNAIITGPNAAGKSTMLRAVNIAVYLAQTLGIAPAKEMALTPFSFIGTYLDIQDNLSAGVSTFMAEAQRAVNIYREHKSRPKDAFSLITMDEMFKGASEGEAPALSYSFARVLSEEPNVITLIASHFRIMQQLEKDTNGHFKNYMFVADESGPRVTYPFSIRPGASKQQVAVRILEEQEFGVNEIAKYAKARVRDFDPEQ